jgi:hypothetical protein
MKDTPFNRVVQLQKLLIKYLFYFFSGFFITTIATTTGFCQNTASSENTLPPAAQEAINKGIMAAKLPDYLLAIRYFQDARKIAPAAAEIFFNLGLAESKIPGRELRAICWFSAYLTVNPTAPNAAAVKEQLRLLLIKSQSNVSQLIRSVQNAAVQIKWQFMEEVASLWGESGDITSALKIVDLTDRKDLTKYSIAETQIETGDILGAQKIADLIEDRGVKSDAQAAIAKAQAEAGDISGAQAILASAQITADAVDADQFGEHGKISVLNSIARAQSAIAYAQVKSGMLHDAEITVNLIGRGEEKSDALSFLASAKAARGDIAGAQATVASARATLESLIKNPHYGDGGSFFHIDAAEDAIAESQIKAGDIEGAKKTTNLISQDSKYLKQIVQQEVNEKSAYNFDFSRFSNTQNTLPHSPRLWIGLLYLITTTEIVH